MKKVLVRLYATAVLLTLLGAASYGAYDLSRIKTRAYAAARTEAAELAAAISRGRLAVSEYPAKLLAVRLLGGETEQTLYLREPRLTLAGRVIGGDFSFPVGEASTGRALVLRMRLIMTDEITDVLRLMMLTGTSALLLTGLVIAFTPRSAKPLMLTYRAAAPESTEPPRSDEGTSSAASPGSALISREHLPMRLESELRRAASFDQDLSLTLISSSGVPAEQRSQFSFAVTRFFVFRDLCFQYSRDRICVILPNQQLDAAIRTVREFERHLDEKIPGALVAAGVSARSGRLLDAGTLLTEAEEALEKSRSDAQGAVYGFRADPARYRATMATK